jgi:SAM-dependent methyltransferase
MSAQRKLLLLFLELVTHRFENFFEYQQKLAIATVLPMLERHGIELDGKKVAEVGCGEGGILSVLREHFPSAKLFGFDVNPKHIATARARNKPGIVFDVFNILDAPVEVFDFVLFRDVLEYTEDADRALKNLAGMLRPAGLALVAFPPYFSPFGGHQHTVRGSWVKAIPFIHLLPDAIFFRLIAGQSSNREGTGSFIQGYLEDLKRIRRTKVSISGFRHLLNSHHLLMKAEELYIVRPSIAFRYRLPVIRNRVFGLIPFVRELTTSGAEYVLEKV